MPVKKELGESHDIPSTLAKRREREGNDVQPKIKIFAKLAGFHRLPEVLVRCGDDANVYRDCFGAADAVKLTVLQHAQELCL
ncbi:MAG: hypothetical protein EWM72_03305 [Nitrospira sp.]|nr:MAG: hypothetical protein EWM72_03305 [Nitrospira sp.]